MKGLGNPVDAEQGRPRGSARSFTTEGCWGAFSVLTPSPLTPTRFHGPCMVERKQSFQIEIELFPGVKRGRVRLSAKGIQIRARTAGSCGSCTFLTPGLAREGYIEKVNIQERGRWSSSLLRKNRAPLTWPALCGITTTNHRPSDPLRLSTTLEVVSSLPIYAKWTRTAPTMILTYPQNPQSPLPSVYLAPSAFASMVPPKRLICF